MDARNAVSNHRQGESAPDNDCEERRPGHDMSTDVSTDLSTPQTFSVLLAESDPATARRLGDYLKARRVAVTVESRADRAEQRIVEDPPDAVIVSTALPGKGGLAVFRDVRDRYAGPIIILANQGRATDHVVALELGADDYVGKPVNPRLLLARLRALLRLANRARQTGAEEAAGSGQPGSSGSSGRGQLLRVNSLTVDGGSRTVAVDGRAVDLTTAEFELLYFLAQHPGEVLSRDRIYRAVRGIEYDGVDRSIDLRVARLRRKLGDSGSRPALIKSVHGAGYLLATSEGNGSLPLRCPTGKTTDRNPSRSRDLTIAGEPRHADAH